MKTAFAKAAIFAMAAMIALHAVLFLNERQKIAKGYPDFTIFYAAGRILSAGQARQLYNLELQFSVERDFAPQVQTRQGALPYNHPPFEALLFRPLARLPYVAAFAVWDVVNLATLALLPWLLGGSYPGFRKPANIFLCWGVSLAFFPVFVGLLQGQDVFLLVLLELLAFAALKRNSDFAAGAWLGLGTFRIHLVLPLILLLLAWRRYRAGAGFALISVIMALISVGIVGWPQAIGYPGLVLHLEKVGGWGAIAPPAMPNLRGLFEGWFPGGSSPEWIRWLVLALSAGMLVLVAAFFRRRQQNLEPSQFDLSFCAAVVATVLVSYHTLTHDLCVLLLPIGLLVHRRILAGQHSTKRNLLLWGSIGLLFVTPFYMLAGLRFQHFNLFALPLLALLAGIFREARPRGADPHPGANVPAG